MVPVNEQLMRGQMQIEGVELHAMFAKCYVMNSIVNNIAKSEQICVLI